MQRSNKLTSNGTLLNANGNGQLYRNGSPNSLNLSARLSPPSICYSDDMSNDAISIEDDVHDLNQKFEQLQRQVETLTESQTSNDERYIKTKQENEALLNRIHGLEDQIREIELASEARQKEDEKRFRDAMAKQARAQSHECEQHLHTNYLLQQELLQAKSDLIKSESKQRKLLSEKATLEEEIRSKSIELSSLDQVVHQLKEQVRHLKEEENVKSTLISVLNDELNDSHKQTQDQRSSEQLRCRSSLKDDRRMSEDNHDNASPQTHRSMNKTKIQNGSWYSSSSINNRPNNDDGTENMRLIDELESNLKLVREENRSLREANEELQAQLLNSHLEEGRSLVQEGNKSYSLADEIGDIDVHQVVKALKEQQEDNARLRDYIDNILLNIVENHPQLLDRTVSQNTSFHDKSTINDSMKTGPP